MLFIKSKFALMKDSQALGFFFLVKKEHLIELRN